MITPQQFGANGDGSDQTAAMQQWAAAVSEGQPGYLPTGIYGISQELDFTAGMIVIQGDSKLLTTIQMLSPMQYGLVFSGGGRLDLSDFAINAPSNSVGANIWVKGGPNAYVGNTLRRIWMNSCCYGIYSSGLAGFRLDDLDIHATSYCMCIADPGDSTIVGGQFTPDAGGVGMYFSGDCGGLKIVAPKVNGSNYNVAVSMSLNTSDGDVQIIGGSYEGWSQTGLVVNNTPNVTFNNISVIGAQLAGVGRAIQFPNAANQMGINGRVVISNNIFQSTQGVAVDGLSDFVVKGNVMPDRGALIWIGPHCIDGEVVGNRMFGPGTIQNTAGASVFIGKNPGFN